MTTRENVRRRVWQARLLVIALLLGLIALQTFGSGLGVPQELLKSTALAGLGVAVLYLYRTPCLNCRRPLGLFAFRITGAYRQRPNEAAPHCPHCDASVDRNFPPSPR